MPSLENPPRPPSLRVEAGEEGLSIPPGPWWEIEPWIEPSRLSVRFLERVCAEAAARAARVCLQLPLAAEESLRGLNAPTLARLGLRAPPGTGGEALARRLAAWRRLLDPAELVLTVSGRAADRPFLEEIRRAASSAGVSRLLFEPALPAAPSESVSPAPRRFFPRRLVRTDLVPGPRPDPETERRRDCSYPWEWAFSTRDSVLTPCPVVREAMGNWAAAGFTAAWESEEFRLFRRRLLSSRPAAACRRCPLRPWFRPPRRSFWAWSGEADARGASLGTGWWPDEGLPFRWSREEGRVLLEGTGETRLGLVLARPPGRGGRTGTVLVGDKPVGRWRLPWPGDRLLVYDVPPAFGNIEVVLRPDRTRSPQPGEEDARVLGAAWKGAVLLR